MGVSEQVIPAEAEVAMEVKVVAVTVGMELVSATVLAVGMEAVAEEGGGDGGGGGRGGAGGGAKAVVDNQLLPPRKANQPRHHPRQRLTQEQHSLRDCQPLLQKCASNRHILHTSNAAQAHVHQCRSQGNIAPSRKQR